MDLSLKKLKESLATKRKVTLGIDLGSQLTKIVKLSHKENRQPHLDFGAIIEMSPKEPSFASTLHDFLEQKQLLKLHAATCLEDESFKIRKIELPKMPDADLKEAIRWKMRDVVEGAIEDYVVRSSLLPETPGMATSKVNMIGYAVRKDSVNHRIDLLGKAGLHVTFVEPSIVSLAYAVESIHSSDEQWIACIDLGASQSIMAILGNGRLYFSRPLANIRMLDSSFREESFNKKLAAEVQNTLDTFAVTFSEEQISRILLSGGGAKKEGLTQYLTTNLGVQTEVMNPFIKVQYDSPMETVVKDKAYLYSQALALAQIRL